jgi:hypothetical protein
MANPFITPSPSLFNVVIPGCALLGADPESSAEHCSGFRVRAPEGAPRNDDFWMDARVKPAHDGK